MDFINHRLDKSANLLYHGNEEYKRYEECIEKYKSLYDVQEEDDYDEDEEEYDEFEDEYEKEDDAEDLEEKEQQNIDDMAIDSYDEEDEE